MQRLIAAIVTVCFTTSVLATDLNGLNGLDREPRAMLYVQQPLGARPGKGSAMRFGLRLDQASSDFGSDEFAGLRVSPFETPSIRTTVPLTDLYFTTAGDYSFAISGMAMLDTGFEDTAFTGDSWTNFWFWVAAGLLGASVLCLTENLICEDDEGEPEPQTPETPDG